MSAPVVAQAGERVLICGSRSWDDRGRVLHEISELLHRYGNGLTVIAGAARGADSIAASWAKTLNLNLIEVSAEWSKYGRRAGYVRNQLMLDMAPALVVAFWDGKSKGTKHTIDEARKRGIPVEVISPASAQAALPPPKEPSGPAVRPPGNPE